GGRIRVALLGDTTQQFGRQAERIERHLWELRDHSAGPSVGRPGSGSPVEKEMAARSGGHRIRMRESAARLPAVAAVAAAVAAAATAAALLLRLGLADAERP